MRRFIDSGLFMRLAIIVANLWLVGGLAEVINYSGSPTGRMNTFIFILFGAVAILGSALVIQKTLEIVERRVSRSP